MIALRGAAKVHQVVVILAVVAGDLTGRIKFVEQLGSQNGPHFRNGSPGVQAVGEEQEDILFFHAPGIQLIQTGADGDFAVAGGLTAALDDIRDNKDNPPAGGGHGFQRLHADGAADGFKSRVVKTVPVLRKAGGVRDRDAGDEHVRAVRQPGAHHAVSILEIKIHNSTLSVARMR